MKHDACPYCKGTGLDRSIGHRLRVMRLKTSLSLREAARRINVSAAHLCDLEHDRRNWNPVLQRAFIKACAKP